MFNLDGSRAEVASQYPRVFQKPTRHVVIATGLQASSLCANAQGTAGGGVQRVLKGSINFLGRALTTEMYYWRGIRSSIFQNSTS